MVPCMGNILTRPKQARPGAYLLPSSAFYFPRHGTRAPPVPTDGTKRPTSCVHPFLSFQILDSLVQGLVCMCVCERDLAACFMLVSEVRLVNIFINKYQTVFGLS